MSEQNPLGAVYLKDCPPGLFLFDRTLNLKLAEADPEGHVQAIVVGTGEAFRGNVQDAWKRDLLVVIPVTENPVNETQIEQALADNDRLQWMTLTHRKRSDGTFYIERHRGHLLCDIAPADGEVMVAVQDEQREWFFIPADEFDEGDYEQLEQDRTPLLVSVRGINDNEPWAIGQEVWLKADPLTWHGLIVALVQQQELLSANVRWQDNRELSHPVDMLTRDPPKQPKAEPRE